MRSKTFILVFPGDVLWLDDAHNPLMAMLDAGDECYTLDGNVAFLRTALDIEVLTSRFAEGCFGERQFLLTDITGADRAGTMMPVFWERFSVSSPQAEAA